MKAASEGEDDRECETKKQVERRCPNSLLSGSSLAQFDFCNIHPISTDCTDLASSELIPEATTDLVISPMEPNLLALKDLSSLVKEMPYISHAAGIIYKALEIRNEIKQYNKDLKVVMEKLTSVGNFLVDVGTMCQKHGLKESHLPQGLLDGLRSFQSELEGIVATLKECADVKGVRKLINRTNLLRKVERYDKKLSHILQVFQAKLGLLSLLNPIIEGRDRDVGSELEECGALIRGLPCTEGWPFGDEKRCLPGTREDFLEHITKWVENPRSERGLVILGQAGTGKSSIAHEVARLFENKCLGSYFAFQRKEGSKDKAYQLFTTLARDLSYYSPAFKLAIGRVIKDNPYHHSHNNGAYHTLFRRLLVEPLGLPQLVDPILIIIDALDESGDAIGKKGLHTFLAQHLSELPPNFRVLITSRPEIGVLPAFANASSVHTLSMTDDKLAQTEKDIGIYLQSELRPEVFEEHGVKLTKAADSLFQWAAVACGFINGPDSLGLSIGECVERLLDHSRGQTGQGLLDSLYEGILEEYFKSPEAQKVFRSIMGQILAAVQPLSIDSLIALRRHASKDDRHDSYRVLGILSYLGSLLSNVTSSDRTLLVVPLHTSFRDFLTTKKSDIFYVDLPNSHHQLAHSCLDLMLDGLKFNICELESSYFANSDVPDMESRISEHIPSALSYASVFWGIHLKGLALEYDLFTKLQFLFGEKFLFWLEVLSLKNSVGIALPAFSSLLLWLQPEGSQTGVKNLLGLVNDASRFVRYFGMAIARSTPHIYISALPFAPSSSRIFKQYFHRFGHTLTFERGQLSHWPALEMVIIDAGTISIAFSPDGQRIASASGLQGHDIYTICVWDAATGQVVVGPFTGHTKQVLSIAFSPDGQRIASASQDRTIRVWDAATGQVVVGPFTGHTHWVNSVAFSPDGQRIASGSRDCKIRVWDAATGQVVVRPFTGHTSWVNSVAFSPDGQRIASASFDRTILVWDAATGQVVAGPFTGHTDQVNSVAFSPDGQRIASASTDHTIRVWDAATGQVVVRLFTGRTDSVNSVAFSLSPDGQRIASASEDHTIRVWDVTTGQVVAGPFTGHTGLVNSVAFSPDGQRIASASSDCTIRIWGAITEQVVGALFTGHINTVNSVTFSPDGQRIASASFDNTIRVWDAATGRIVAGPFTGHAGSVRSVAFSPDGWCIASASVDRTIRVWDAATGQVVVRPFTGHTDLVNSVAFSPDGQRIASASKDRTIRVWDAATGHVVAGPFTGHTSSVNSVAFSPNGQHIASSSEDCKIHVWDVANGHVVVGPFTGHTKRVNFVAFSPNGQHIASASDDRTIRVWGAATRQAVAGPFTGHTDWVLSVAFSPDGQYIASASFDFTIRVWDVATGQVVAGPFTGNTHWVSSVAFSPDGRHIASASYDHTIRMWDAATGQVVAGSSTGYTESDGPYFTDQTLINKDGWILGPGGEKELLFWIPNLHRLCLHRPSTVWVAGEHETRLDLSNCAHGSSWATVYRSNLFK